MLRIVGTGEMAHDEGHIDVRERIGRQGAELALGDEPLTTSRLSPGYRDPRVVVEVKHLGASLPEWLMKLQEEDSGVWGGSPERPVPRLPRGVRSPEHAIDLAARFDLVAAVVFGEPEHPDTWASVRRLIATRKRPSSPPSRSKMARTNGSADVGERPARDSHT